MANTIRGATPENFENANATRHSFALFGACKIK